MKSHPLEKDQFKKEIILLIYYLRILFVFVHAFSEFRIDNYILF